MNCHEAEELLMRALDGELPAGERRALDAHVQGCPACREAEQAWRQAGDLLRAQRVPAPPAEVMWADVRRAIRLQDAQPEGGPLLGWRMGWATAIVAAVFVGWIGFATWRAQRIGEARQLAEAASGPQVEWADAEMPGSSTMVYEDEESGVAVIWLLTAENGAEGPAGT